MHKWVRAALDLLYPRDVSCAICGEEADLPGKSLCKRCDAAFPPQLIERHDVAGLSFLRAAFPYREPIVDAIHRFKYGEQRYLARFAAERMHLLLPEGALFLVAVPLHPTRRKERGFSQTEELCDELAQLSGAASLRDVLRRTRNTPSQTHLSAADRAANLTGAFVAGPAVAGKRIALIDDVATTGSTLRECTYALRDAGAMDVGAVVLAT